MAKVWDINLVPGVLNQLYQRVLERQPDPVGTIFFGCMLTRGEQSVRDLVRDTGHSQEYQNRFITPLSIPDGVKACYRHFLARDADPGGLQAWEQVAATQGFGAVIDGMIGSNEYTQRFGADQVPE